MTNPLRQVLTGGLWSVGLRLGQVSSAYLVILLLARNVPPAELGLFFLVTAYASLAALVGPLGLTTLAVKNISTALQRGDPLRADLEARSIFLHAVAASVVIAATGGVYSLSNNFQGGQQGAVPSPGTVLLVTGLGALLALQSVLSELLRGFNRIVAASLLNGSLSWMMAAAIIGGIALRDGLASSRQALAVLVVSTSVALLVGLLLLARNLFHRGRIFRYRFGEAAPFLAIQVSTFFFYQADLLVASLVLPLGEVAVYGAAVRFLQLLVVPLDSLEGALLPHLAGIGTGPLDESKGRLLRKTALLQTLSLAAGTLVFALWGEEIISLCLDPAYVGARTILLILLLGWLVRAAMGAYGHTMIMAGHGTELMRLTLRWGLLCAPAEYLAWRLAGAHGIAAAAALLLGSFCIIGAIVAHRYTRLNVTVLPEVVRLILKSRPPGGSSSRG